MLKKVFYFCAVSFTLSSYAHGFFQSKATYVLTIHNGGEMPFSPVLVYASSQERANVKVGDTTTEGFVKLCQTGDNSLRETELQQDSQILAISKGDNLILPGETKSIEITAPKKHLRSINIETMYGNTKDTCAVVNIDRFELHKLKHHRVYEVVGHDRVLSTGAFSDPTLEDADNKCNSAPNAVTCLRNLSEAGDNIVRFFPDYLPSVLNFLEENFGVDQTLSLLVPTSGALRYSLKLKH